MEREDWSLYFHIPFCEHHCNYCDFFTTAHHGREMILRYMSYLSRELDLYAAHTDTRKVNIQSIYIGGGTPSFIPTAEVASLIAKIRGKFDVADDVEITVEVNPKSAFDETFVSYRTAGINRLSIGVQSLHSSELRVLERIHSPADSIATMEAARKSGFTNISVDLLYSIPGQTVRSWNETLSGMVTMHPEHISAYSLVLEQGTKMTELVRSGAFILPDEDTTADMYNLACEYMEKKGYEHYEVSNYSLPGYASHHNIHNWERKPYKGFGMSAHSFSHNERSWNTKDFTTYFNKIDSGILPVEDAETLSEIQQMNEEIMFRLRTSGGLDFRQFARHFGMHNAELLKQSHAKLAPGKTLSRYILHTDGKLRFTTAGFFVSDEIISRLLINE